MTRFAGACAVTAAEATAVVPSAVTSQRSAAVRSAATTTCVAAVSPVSAVAPRNQR
jgi:hypothetical protein